MAPSVSAHARHPSTQRRSTRQIDAPEDPVQAFIIFRPAPEPAMTSPAFRAFKANLAMLLRDMPIGTTADFSDVAVAYWNGTQVAGAYLRDGGRLDEDFEFDENAWESWQDELAGWQANPTFTEREELKARLQHAAERAGKRAA
ncbi:hypothetical protein [Cupriavidus sp. USMAHM13]|uniref:hypothetical protein n=1 Tax=Cupriavidus sp. USMAHM13 TaxID=1389192 RepID=UPI001E30C4CA|nr:hypothetical protein [Cupriavidus sp. USMAHM13]